MRKVIAAILAAFLAVPLAFADDKHHKKEGAAAPGAAQPSSMVDGEVRKVDKDAQKITIRHGPLPQLDMPAMTMVYRVKDAALLGKVKAGDKVKFEAEKVGGAYTVTEIEPAR